MQLSLVTDAGMGPKALTTVAEALERLSRDPVGFRPGDQATFNVADLTLPNGRTVPSPAIIFSPSPVSELAFAALLAPAGHCWATDPASGKRETYDMHLLHAAIIDHEGRATLSNGATLRAIEVASSRIPEPSALDWQILKAFIAARGAEDQCYRSVIEGLAPNLAARVPHLAKIRRIDCSRLSELEPRLLKLDLYDVQQMDPSLQISEEKLAQTLAVFGIRIRKPRRR